MADVPLLDVLLCRNEDFTPGPSMGPKWFLKGVNSRSLRVELAPLWKVLVYEGLHT